MKSFIYQIQDAVGVHAKPANALVEEAKKYKSKIIIKCENGECDATKLMDLLGLGIMMDDYITVEITGEDEDVAAAEFEVFMKDTL